VTSPFLLIIKLSAEILKSEREFLGLGGGVY